MNLRPDLVKSGLGLVDRVRNISLPPMTEQKGFAGGGGETLLHFLAMPLVHDENDGCQGHFSAADGRRTLVLRDRDAGAFTDFHGEFMGRTANRGGQAA